MKRTRVGWMGATVAGALLAAGGTALGAEGEGDPHAKRMAKQHEGMMMAAPSEADIAVAEKVHQANLEEIELGKLAEKKGKLPSVREYGAMLVRDHEMADRMLMGWAKMAKVPADKLARPAAEAAAGAAAKPEAKPEEKAEIESIEKLSGDEFDRQFAARMVDDHRKAVDLVSTARNEVRDKKLEAALGRTLPLLEKHLRRAEALVKQTKARELRGS